MILKLDIEGGEYELLEHLIETGADGCVELALVEWHDLPAREADRDSLIARLRCPVEPW